MAVNSTRSWGTFYTSDGVGMRDQLSLPDCNQTRLQQLMAPCRCTLQARVLAARDHSGVVPLLEGRTAAGSLIIACGTYLPEGTSQMTEIKAGEQHKTWNF